MTLHEEWTDKLSDFLDDELTPEERDAVESHLDGCAACARVLEELKAVTARARALESRPPAGDLWPGIAARIDPGRGRVVQMPPAAGRTRLEGRRFSFTMPQLAAAAVLIAVMSGGLAWSLRDRATSRGAALSGTREAAAKPPLDNDGSDAAPRPAADAVPVSLADAQYDAAVADLEKALKEGRGRLDPQTITVVEHNLQTIDEAIRQAREALAGDPANTYLSGHLLEARRRKLDLLRRAAELTSESD
jgi:hypothetical protein